MAAPMKPSTKRALLASWFDNVTQAELASLHKVSADAIRKFWARSIVEGLLPSAPRPFFADHCIAAREPAGAATSLETDIDRSERIAEGSADRNVISSAGLLAALMKHHGDDDHRARDMTATIAQHESAQRKANSRAMDAAIKQRRELA